MVDIKLVREQPEKYQQAVRDKGLSLDIKELLAADKKRSQIQQQVERIRFERNQLDEKIKKADTPTRPGLISAAAVLKKQLASLEPELKAIEIKFRELMSLVPVLPSADTPLGPDDKSNREISVHGQIPEFDFPPLDHITLGKNLDILDFESGVRVSGNRGYVLKNEGVLLHLAVLWHAVQKLRVHGFTLVVPPIIIKSFALFGSGHFPFDKDNVYRVVPQGHIGDKEKNESLFLGGTSEPSLLAMNAGKVFDEGELPLRLCGFSPCFRSEAGSYGRDAKGLYRVHEFWKVEQVVICANEVAVSEKWLQELLKISQEILSDLELPFRVVQNASGDMGAGKYKMYDLETWMPSRKNYGETHSDSALLDWQARRLNIKYKKKSGQTEYVHTLNNTGIASPRILIPLLENHQQADGSVAVPKVLQPYLGTKLIKSLK